MNKQPSNEPLIPASQSLPEITLKGIILAAILVIVLAAANTYLGLKVGLTISASIPASIIALGTLRLFRRHNVLESNIVQTAASAGEALAAGTIFTLPALIIVHFWFGFHYWESVLLILTGGIIGVFFSIPLRRILLSDRTLRFPEGLAIGNILKVSTQAGSDLKYLVYGGIVGAVISFCQSGLMVLAAAANFWVKGFGTLFGLGAGFDAAIIGAGYIVGMEVGISVFAGAVLGWFIGIPILGWVYGIAATQSATQIAIQFWTEHVRYIGVGVMLTGGVWTLVKLGRPLISSLMASFQAIKRGSTHIHAMPRTDRDIPINYVMWGIGFAAVCVLAISLDFTSNNVLGMSSGMQWSIALTNVVFILTVGFVLAAICGYMAGLIGSSNNPLSGLAMAAIILISFILLVLLKLQVDFVAHPEKIDKAVALAIIVVVMCATSGAIASDNLQDLKAGQMVGATPWKQQLMLMFGVCIAAFIIPPILNLLFHAYGIGGVYPRANMDSTQMLAAPQATLIASIARGIIAHNLSWTMINIGILIAVFVIIFDEWLQRKYQRRFPVLAVGLGVYLPISASVPIIFGALVSFLVNRCYRQREQRASSAEKLKIPALKQRGLVLACGLVAGAAITGVVMAIPAVLTKKLCRIKHCFNIVYSVCQDFKYYSDNRAVLLDLHYGHQKMELIRGLHNLHSKHAGCVATIGNFDGMHIGHQQIFSHLKEQAQALGLPVTVIIFEPHPQEFFAKDNIPPRLTRLREKLILLKEFAVDRVLCLRFDKQLAEMPAEDFVERVLVQQLAIKYLLIGDDFRFGYQRQGDFPLLQQLAIQYNFTIENTQTVVLDHERISSTLIRNHLLAGELSLAKPLLGREYSMYGRVVHGEKQGRILGFPTANLYLHRQKSPVLGVFAVKIYGINSQVYCGVADVGNRPTYGGSRTILEVHIFDFDRDIYGHYLRIEFLHKFRDEKKYDSLELLTQQIMFDAQNARNYFGI